MAIQLELSKPCLSLAQKIVDSNPHIPLDDIARAAGTLACNVSMVCYQIIAYAERNNFCHTSLQTMINHGDFQELAKRMIEDKRALDVTFSRRPHEQTET